MAANENREIIEKKLKLIGSYYEKPMKANVAWLSKKKKKERNCQWNGQRNTLFRERIAWPHFRDYVEMSEADDEEKCGDENSLACLAAALESEACRLKEEKQPQ